MRPPIMRSHILCLARYTKQNAIDQKPCRISQLLLASILRQGTVVQQSKLIGSHIIRDQIENLDQAVEEIDAGDKEMYNMEQDV